MSTNEKTAANVIVACFHSVSSVFVEAFIDLNHSLLIIHHQDGLKCPAVLINYSQIDAQILSNER